MKKALLSAAALTAVLALPTCRARANQRHHHRHLDYDHRTCRGVGIPERNALEFVPKEIGGVPLKVIVLDDGGDPTNATTNARRFVTNPKPTSSWGRRLHRRRSPFPTSPMKWAFPIGLAPFPITPERAKWSIDMPQPVPIMGKVLYEHMKAHNIKTVGYIGHSIPTAISGSTTSRSRADRWACRSPTRSASRGRYIGRGTGVEAVRGQSRRGPGWRVRHRAGLPQTALRERGDKGLITRPTAPRARRSSASPAPRRKVIMASGPRRPEDQPDSALTKKPGLAPTTPMKPNTANSRTSSPAIPTMLSRHCERDTGGIKTASPVRRIPRSQSSGLPTEREIAASQGVHNFTEKDRYGLDDRRALLTVKDGKTFGRSSRDDQLPKLYRA